jgi:hypothetical protein
MMQAVTGSATECMLEKVDRWEAQKMELKLERLRQRVEKWKRWRQTSGGKKERLKVDKAAES